MRDQETIEREAAKLAEIGGVRWTKNGMDRVYFNSLAERIGFDFRTYTLRGEKVSRREVGRILGVLSSTKIYYDLNTGRLCDNGVSGSYAGEAYDAILAEVREALK